MKPNNYLRQKMESAFKVLATTPGEVKLGMSAPCIIILSLFPLLAFYNELSFVACKSRLKCSERTLILKYPPILWPQNGGQALTGRF